MDGVKIGETKMGKTLSKDVVSYCCLFNFYDTLVGKENCTVGSSKFLGSRPGNF